MLPAEHPFPDDSLRQGEIDHKLLACVISLLALGLVMVFSASSGSALAKSLDKFGVLRAQVTWAVLGLGAMGLMARMDYHKLRALARPLLGLSFVLLLLVFAPGVGHTAGGGTRWIRVAGFGFQPSELARLSLILFLADLLSRRDAERGDFRAYVLPCLLVTGALCVLVLTQPNLSYTILLFAVGFLMVWVRYRHWHHMAGVGMVSVVAAGGLILAEPYRLRRYMAFLDPWADPYGSGWNIIQSLYALSSGGLWGLGIGRGRQKFEYLPQEHSDYIFAILGEELGFLGGAAVLLLFAILLWRGLRAASRAPDLFGLLLAYGVTMSLVLQAIVNVSVVVGSIPPTGVPLPFLSSGGTALVSSLFAVGILLSISRLGSLAPPRGRGRRRRPGG